MNANPLAIDSPSAGLRLMLALVGAALVGVLAVLLMTPHHPGTPATTLERVDRCIDEDGVMPYSRASIEDMLRLPFAGSAGCWQATALPEHVGATGLAIRETERPLRRVWFRASYRVPEHWNPGDPLAIHVPRIMGEAWLLRVNGNAVADNLADWRMTWNRPLDVQLMPIPWLTWLIYSFVATFSERRVRWMETLLPVYVLSLTFAALPVWHKAFNVDLLIVTVYTVVGMLAIGVICWMAAASRSTELRVITAVLLLSALAAANDLALIAHRVDPERYFLLPYIGVLLFASFLNAVQRRYAHAITSHEKFRSELGIRLQQREDELTRQHRRVLELERAQTLILERQRLMRDMHDGLGSTLASSLAAAERGLIAQPEVAELLRDCVDDLRAVIDSLEPVEHDLVALLANLRFRLGRRLDAAGIALEWSMGDLAPLAWLGPSEALHVMRVVQEALANAVKHAHARRVGVEAGHDEGAVRVCIADDGIGFDTGAPAAGRGLRLLRQRVQLLGGRIEIQSQAGAGTRVTLRMPVKR